MSKLKKLVSNKFIIVTILFVCIIVFMTLFVEPKNAEYLLPSRGITCWECSHEIKGEKCDNCGASVLDDGLLTRRDYICSQCGKQLFWTYTGECYYCRTPQNLSYEKFSSKFSSYESYKEQLNQLKIFSNIVLVIIVVYVVIMIILVVLKIRKNRSDKK